MLIRSKSRHYDVTPNNGGSTVKPIDNPTMYVELVKPDDLPLFVKPYKTVKLDKCYLYNANDITYVANFLKSLWVWENYNDIHSDPIVNVLQLGVFDCDDYVLVKNGELTDTTLASIIATEVANYD